MNGFDMIFVFLLKFFEKFTNTIDIISYYIVYLDQKGDLSIKTPLSQISSAAFTADKTSAMEKRIIIK